MTIRDLTPADVDGLAAFFGALSEEDLTFIREDVHDRAVIAQLPHTPDPRWIAVDGPAITGYAAAERLPGWSDHVGELRLAVHPARRRAGLGRRLAQHALAAALRAGMRKVVVELAADQEHAIAMFSGLGFIGEAMLHDHIRDRQGDFSDLVVLAHHVDEQWSALDAVGLAGALMP
jgi:ribosomal protein S18 acetylase RimI-like enzyme